MQTDKTLPLVEEEVEDRRCKWRCAKEVFDGWQGSDGAASADAAASNATGVGAGT